MLTNTIQALYHENVINHMIKTIIIK